MENIRIFLGIELGEIPLLNDWVDTLQCFGYGDKVRLICDVRWHITLKYIGGFPISRISEFAGKLRDGFRQNDGGNLVIEGAGFFGSMRAPKVLWAGVSKAEWLDELNRTAENLCLETGISVSPKPFTPHLTLARIRQIERPIRLIDEVKRHEGTRWYQQKVKEVVLYKSDLTTDGPVYSVINRFELMHKKGR